MAINPPPSSGKTHQHQVAINPLKDKPPKAAPPGGLFPSRPCVPLRSSALFPSHRAASPHSCRLTPLFAGLPHFSPSSHFCRLAPLFAAPPRPAFAGSPRFCRLASLFPPHPTFAGLPRFLPARPAFAASPRFLPADPAFCRAASPRILIRRRLIRPPRTCRLSPLGSSTEETRRPPIPCSACRPPALLFQSSCSFLGINLLQILLCFFEYFLLMQCIVVEICHPKTNYQKYYL